ncbi:helix-turn-helix transcriptional regulator [Streptomyces sp. NPDC020799]|uniref:helix-turn-helix transcriptional regulator n=1 Tax=Streptomyces sp. NPDC020799 TaxID=3365091 RepID=UPI003496C489
MSLEELRGLPTAVSVVTAARALGVSRDTAYKLVRAGTFPAQTFMVGETRKVATASLWKVLDVHP